MGDITAFPTRHTILVTDPQVANFLTLTAAEDIKAGMVVTVVATTGNQYATPGNSGDTGPVVGIALYDSSSGDPVTVCCAGSICYVANESASAAIGEGVTLVLSNTDGTVMAASTGAAYVVGVSLEDIAADGWGRAIIMPYEQVVS
jgi:predicted RecA/RadA family phage recombinase